METSKHGPARALMFQGTGSDVGKSLVVAGLCRAYARRGLIVRPFKPQNMSNNAAVTIDGGEIGRAQALQARAARADPASDMNPVLLKPQTDTGSQVVVRGRMIGNATARDYHDLKATLLPQVLESFRRLSEDADLILIEGAGSPAEINLRDGDIANMGFAEAADIPVVLVADIDRGGVIASLIGTHALLSETERARMAGYLINKFRGDVTLFDGAIDQIKTRCAMDCLGIVPYFPKARLLPDEDSMSLDRRGRDADAKGDGVIRIAVLRLSRIANFDDLDPLLAEKDIVVDMIEPGSAVPGNVDVVIIPGTKSTLADLDFLRRQEWHTDIAAHVRRGGVVVGLCGGYQMLGNKVIDPDGIEGKSGGAPGLGLLDIETVITGDKSLETVRGSENLSGAPVHGYEMHTGLSEGPGRVTPWFMLDDGRSEGAVSPDGRIFGSYLHGLFAADNFRHRFLARLRPELSRTIGDTGFEKQIEDTLDQLADHLEASIDLDHLLTLAGRISQ